MTTPPAKEHPKRPVKGFECARREVSGERFWNFFREECGSAERFFENCAVYNHCPLAYMAQTGKNVTPVDMKARHREGILAACDRALAAVIRLLGVDTVVGIGNYARDRTLKVLADSGMAEDVRVEVVLHPSPASPAANAGWGRVVRKQLEDLGLMELIRAEKAKKGEENDGVSKEG